MEKHLSLHKEKGKGREEEGDVTDQKQGKGDSTGKGRKPVEEGRETRRGTGRFSTGKKKKRQEVGKQHIKKEDGCIYFSIEKRSLSGWRKGEAL